MAIDTLTPMSTHHYHPTVSKVSRILTVVLGACFLIIGILTTLNSIAWTVQTHTIGYQALLYAALNFVFSYGLFQKRSWAGTIAGFNLAFGLIALGDALFIDTAVVVPMHSIVLTAINTLLCVALYINKSTLTSSYITAWPLILFFAARLFPILSRML